MIKCNINRKKGKVWVKSSGTAEEMMVETAALVQLIYQGIHKENPEAAKVYKTKLIGVLLDPKTPVWKEPDHDSN